LYYYILRLNVKKDVEVVQQVCNTELMKPLQSIRANAKDWPKKATFGRIQVSIYRRRTPRGNLAYMVANYADGKRRLDSYPTEPEAMEAAQRLARQLSQRDVMSASITKEQAIEYAAAIQTLQPLGISLTAAVSTLAEAVKVVGDLPNVTAAATFYSKRHKQTVAKRVSDVADELIKIKASRGASLRYLADLRGRLKKFGEVFQKDIGNVTTTEIQDWLDTRKLSTQSYANNRRVVHLLFEFAVTRGYAIDNPVVSVEQVKVKNGDTQIFTPSEIAKLLAVASPDFLPCITISAFAGLRSAEIERLEWSNIDFAGRHITIGANAAKTASRRVVPIQENLAEWLSPYVGRKGKIWNGGWLYKAQQQTAKAAGIKWKQNALRHSYVSYRLAQTQNASQVALECGNSPQMIFRHYHELVKPDDAVKWFNMKPAVATNVIMLATANS
jgi:integrase